MRPSIARVSEFIHGAQKQKVTRRRSVIEQMCFQQLFEPFVESSTARSAAGKQFQTRGPATANDLSASLVLVLRIAHGPLPFLPFTPRTYTIFDAHLVGAWRR